MFHADEIPFWYTFYFNFTRKKKLFHLEAMSGLWNGNCNRWRRKWWWERRIWKVIELKNKKKKVFLDTNTSKEYIGRPEDVGRNPRENQMVLTLQMLMFSLYSASLFILSKRAIFWFMTFCFEGMSRKRWARDLFGA